MPLLTQRDVLIAIVKDTTSQVPGIGPFVAEGVGAIDQRATIDALEERIIRLETALLDCGFIKQGTVERDLMQFIPTADFNLVQSRIEASLSTAADFEKFIVGFADSPSLEFKYFRNGIQLKMVHDLLRRFERDGPSLTDEARNGLISIATEVLSRTSPEDDFLINYSIGADSESMQHVTYLGDTWHALGWHLLSSARYFDAMRCFIRSIELGADPVVPLLNIANSFLGLGSVEYAIDKYRILAKMYAYSLPIRHRLAAALAGNNNLDEAAIHYKFYAEEFDKRVAGGCSFPPESHAWRTEAQIFLENLTLRSTGPALKDAQVG